MFYNERLVSNKDLAKAWKAANDISDSDGECDLPDVCRTLDSWISNDAFEIHRRLSLRTASTLVSGAAKLYKTGVRKLLEDVKLLDDSLARTHVRRRGNTNICSVSHESSESVKSPERIRRQNKTSFETSVSPNKRPKVISSSLSGDVSSYSRSHFRSNRYSASGSATSPEQLEKSTKSRKDQAVQTSWNTYSQEAGGTYSNESFDEDGLDMELPYGCVLVYDNHRSRVPSKIIVSSITSDVRNLISKENGSGKK